MPLRDFTFHQTILMYRISFGRGIEFLTKHVINKL